MNKIMVTDRDVLDMLYDDSALTLEGLAEESIDDFIEWLTFFTELKDEDVYIIKGGVMNMAYGLTGRNAYQSDLTIVCKTLESMKDPQNIIFPRFKIGGRWFDDIVDNNAWREEEK